MAPVRSETRGEVGAGIEAVFAYISDMPRWPEWANDIRECSVAGGGSLMAGAKIAQRVKASGGSTKERVLEVVAVDSPTRIEFSGTYGSSPLRWGFGHSPLDVRRTELLLWVEMDPRGSLRLMPGPMLRKGIRDQNDREIASIKTRVEAEVA